MYTELPRPNAERARLTIMVMYAMVIFYALDTMTYLVLANVLEMDYGMLNTIRVGNGILSFIQSIVGIFTYVFFIQWFRRAYNNLHLMGARNLEFSEGWAAGAWFVPIMSYFRPYKIMVEIWRETQLMGRTKEEGYQEEPPSLVGFWWGAWLLGAFIALFTLFHQLGSIRLGMTVAPVPSDGEYVSLAVANGLYVVAGILVIRIVRKVSAWEDELMQRYNNYITLRQQQQYTQQQEQTNPDNIPGPPPSHPL